DGYWRDVVSFTWNLRALEGREQIRDMVAATVEHVGPSGWALAESATEADGVIEAWITFETRVSRGWGHLRLRGGRAWTLLTTMQELKGYEERKGPRREAGVEHTMTKGRRTWAEGREEQRSRVGYDVHPYEVIVGGRDGGIVLAAGLERQGVATLVLQKDDRRDDPWRNRYKPLHLHHPVWYDDHPYLPFPD